MINSFKLWDKKNKKIIHPETTHDVSITLSGSFKITQKVVTADTSFQTIEVPADEFELIRCIGLTSKDNQKLHVGDIISDGTNEMVVGYGEYVCSPDNWGVSPKHLGCYVTYVDGNMSPLTLNGSSYSVAANKCEFVKYILED